MKGGYLMKEKKEKMIKGRMELFGKKGFCCRRIEEIGDEWGI